MPRARQPHPLGGKQKKYTVKVRFRDGRAPALRITDCCQVVAIPLQAARCYLYHERNIFVGPKDGDVELVLVRVTNPEGFLACLRDEEDECGGFSPRRTPAPTLPDGEERHAAWWSAHLLEVIKDTGAARLCDVFGHAAGMEQPYWWFDPAPEQTRDAWAARAVKDRWGDPRVETGE